MSEEIVQRDVVNGSEGRLKPVERRRQRAADVLRGGDGHVALIARAAEENDNAHGDWFSTPRAGGGPFYRPRRGDDVAARHAPLHGGRRAPRPLSHPLDPRLRLVRDVPPSAASLPRECLSSRPRPAALRPEPPR